MYKRSTGTAMFHTLKASINRIILIGCALVFFSWIADSLFYAYFRHKSLGEGLFPLSPHEVVPRLAVFLMQIAFIAIIVRSLANRNRLEQALVAATKRAELEKARSEAILAEMGDGICILDTDFKIIYQNRAHIAMMGNHLGEYCYSALQGGECVCAGCHVKASFADGQSHFRTLNRKCAEGPRYVEIISNPLKDHDGKIFAGIEAVRDVTERVVLEEERKKNLAAIEAAMDGIAIIGDDERYIYLNEAYAKIYGYEAATELIGKGWRLVYEGQEFAWYEQGALPMLKERGAWRGETIGKKRDGSTFPQELSLTVSPTGYMVCVVRDISERRQAEEKIRDLAGFLQMVIDTIPNPIYYKDAQGGYLGCNKAYEAAMGLARGEIVGKTVFDLHSGSFAETFHDKDRQLLDSPGIQIYESRLRYHDGSWHDVIFTKGTFTDVEGKTAGLVGVMSDITDYKLAEEEIRKLNDILLGRTAQLSSINKELETFSYSLSHDLRNLLTQVFIAAQALEDDYTANMDENGRFFIATIRKASENMEELLDAMLVLAGVTRTDLRIENVDLRQLADQIFTGLRLMEPAREVEFIATSDLMVRGDEHLLRVAMENLLGNAWKYTRKSTAARIELGITECAGETAYFIRDNGAGFSMEDADKLFQPFKRLHRDDEFGGTGVGLATVQRIIERHGGRIWGEGEVGKGATFFFTL